MKNFTVSQSCGKWHVKEYEVAQSEPMTGVTKLSINGITAKSAFCGHTAKENRQSQTKFSYTENVGINGARDILPV